MQTKLTLRLEHDLIEAAKQEAAARDTSVSKLFASFIRSLSPTPSPQDNTDYPPITASLIGSLAGAKVAKEDYIDYLEEKHR